MSDICSEKDCRILLEGERDEFGTSTDMFGESIERGRKEKVFFLTLATGE